jgi:hypothetical protein
MSDESDRLDVAKEWFVSDVQLPNTSKYKVDPHHSLFF